MYQLVSAIAKKPANGSRWEQVEIAAVPMNVLYNTYGRLYMNLTNPFVDGTVSLDFEDVRASASGLELTVAEWLVWLDNTTLPTQALVPALETRYVKYADAFHARYQVTPIPTDLAPDYDVTLADKRSLLLTRDGLDIDLFFKNCLVSVNGFFHLTDHIPEGIKVYEGGRSLYQSRRAACGLYSFREVGEIECVPITREMIYHQGQKPYNERMYVDLGRDLTGKTVGLVLGGYLHLVDPVTFYQVGPALFAINFADYPFLKRYYESKPYVDLSSLPLETTDRNPNQVAVEDLLKDELYEAYVTLSQSFFVVIDTDDLYVDLHKVDDTGLPGQYVSHILPELPLRTGFGRVSEYWYHYEDTQWALSCEAVGIPDYVFTTVDWRDQRNVDDTRYPFHPEDFSPGFFLKICKDF